MPDFSLNHLTYSATWLCLLALCISGFYCQNPFFYENINNEFSDPIGDLQDQPVYVEPRSPFMMEEPEASPGEQMERDRVYDMLMNYNTRDRKDMNLQEVYNAPPDLSKPSPSSNTLVAHKMLNSRSSLKWQPVAIITVGCIGSIFAITLAVGFGLKYKKRGSGNLADREFSGSNNDSLADVDSCDKKLANSAQMYHYQHQKQQMLAMEKVNSSMKNDLSDEEESDADIVDEDYTVYECPGLASTTELEVKNPFFQGEANEEKSDQTTETTDDTMIGH